MRLIKIHRNVYYIYIYAFFQPLLNRKPTGDKRKPTGDKRKPTGDNRKPTGDNRKPTGDKMNIGSIP